MHDDQPRNFSGPIVFEGPVTFPVAPSHVTNLTVDGFFASAGPVNLKGGLTTLQVGDGSWHSQPAHEFYGSKAWWGLGVDQTDPTNPYRNLMFYKYQAGRTVGDAVLVLGSAIVTSATAAFVAGDVGHFVRGDGIPSLTTIASRQSANQVTLSALATHSVNPGYLAIDNGVVTDVIGMIENGAAPVLFQIGATTSDTLREDTAGYRATIWGDTGGIGTYPNIGSVRFKAGYLNVSTDPVGGASAGSGHFWTAQDWGGTDRAWLSHNAQGLATLHIRGDSSVANPSIVLQNTADDVETLRITQNGIIQFNGDGNAAISRFSAGVVGVPNNFNVAGILQFAGDSNAYIHRTGASTLSFGTSVVIDNQLKVAGNVGFNNHAPAAQPALPVTLADVIAVLHGCGLTA